MSRRAVLVGGTAVLMGAGGGDPAWWIDRLREPGVSELGTRWTGFTDGVMGGVSEMRVTVETVDGERCYRMQGMVRTANNGGFVQIALPLSAGAGLDASAFGGVRVRVRGNGERYAVHLRTPRNRLPWDYYSADFEAVPEWRDVVLPFDGFARAQGRGGVESESLVRLALVGIGRDFAADLALSAVAFV